MDHEILEGLLLGDLLGSTVGKVNNYDEAIKLILTDSKVLGTILGNGDDITLGLDVGTHQYSSHRSFDGSNNGDIEVVLLRDELESSDVKVIESDEGIKPGIYNDEGLDNIIVNVDGIALKLDVGKNQGYI